MVVKRSISRRRSDVSQIGGIRSENADISNCKEREIRSRRKIKVSSSTEFGGGIVGT